MKISISLFMIVGLSAGLAAAAPVLDQDQSYVNTYAPTSTYGSMAQSFQQSHDNVSGAGVYLVSNVGTPDNLTIGLWDGLPTGGGVELASGSGVGTLGSWFDVFWSPVAVTPGDTLFLVFSSWQDTVGYGAAYGDPGGAYASGQAYGGGTFVAWPNVDLAFRTYYDDTYQGGNGGGTIPAPGAIVLGAFGAGLVGWFRRRGTL